MAGTGRCIATGIDLKREPDESGTAWLNLKTAVDRLFALVTSYEHRGF
jgi:hypothetical protein